MNDAALLAPALAITLKATILLALSSAVLLVAHRASAAFRHLVWSACMIALILLPAITFFAPSWRILPAWPADKPPMLGRVTAIPPKTIATPPLITAPQQLAVIAPSF